MPQPTQAVGMFFSHVKSLPDLNNKRKELLLKLHPDKGTSTLTTFIQMQAEYERAYALIQNGTQASDNNNNNARWKTDSCLFKGAGQNTFECRCGEKIPINTQDTGCIYECPSCSLCHDISCTWHVFGGIKCSALFQHFLSNFALKNRESCPRIIFASPIKPKHLPIKIICDFTSNLTQYLLFDKILEMACFCSASNDYKI